MEYYHVGKIVNTHGVRGELKIIAETDFPEVRFAKGSRLYCFPPNAQPPFPLEVVAARVLKGTYIVKFKQLDQLTDAEKLKGGTLKISEEQLVDLDDGEYYYHEIVGCTVISEDGSELGIVKEILTPGANDVWVIDRPGNKDLLIPVIDEVVLDVNVTEKVITIHLMEGLLDL